MPDMIKKSRFFARTSPVQTRLPAPNGNNLEKKIVKVSPVARVLKPRHKRSFPKFLHLHYLWVQKVQTNSFCHWTWIHRITKNHFKSPTPPKIFGQKAKSNHKGDSNGHQWVESVDALSKISRNIILSVNCRYFKTFTESYWNFCT